MPKSLRQTAGALLIAAAGFALPAHAAESDPVAQAVGGELRGFLHEGQAVFLGIPYAAPPVENLRWREPEPAQGWNGVRAATEFGFSCMQNFDFGPMSEDCLTLNVWAPEWPSQEPKPVPKPVMVWFHGGGDTSGGTNSPAYYGASLARYSVVVVTVNYRLGPLGFLALPELSAESPHGASGNYGLLDQIASLRWIRDNIAAFGGDPGNVTIWGQSAGAQNVERMMISPLTAGLFHRAIVESGAARRRDPTLAEAERACTQAIAPLNPPQENALAYLRGISAAEILNRFERGDCRPLNIDGYAIAEQNIQVWAEGRAHPVPFLIGNAARESFTEASFDELKAEIELKYGDHAPRAFELYGLTGGTAAAAPAPHPLYGFAYQQWGADHNNRCRVITQNIGHTDAGNRVYQYEFERQLPGQRPNSNMHSNEIYSVFGLTSNPGWAARFSDADRELGDKIQRYWTNFAKTGDPNAAGPDAADPNAAGLPEWPGFSAEGRGYMAFTEMGAEPGANLRRAHCDLFLEVEAERPSWANPERSAAW